MPAHTTTPPAPTASPKLTPLQLAALRALAADPGAYVPAGRLSKLRKLGLVGKHVEKPEAANGWRQKTTSPVTDAGRAAIVRKP